MDVLDELGDLAVRPPARSTITRYEDLRVLRRTFAKPEFARLQSLNSTALTTVRALVLMNKPGIFVGPFLFLLRRLP